MSTKSTTLDETAKPKRISARTTWKTRLRLDAVKDVTRRSETDIVMECIENWLPKIEAEAELLKKLRGEKGREGDGNRKSLAHPEPKPKIDSAKEVLKIKAASNRKRPARKTQGIHSSGSPET